MRRLIPLMVSPSKRSPAPAYLIHFVTSRCNARCPHCFIFEPGDPRFAGQDLTIEEIERFARSLGSSVYNVSLTGGEPFLRKDIADIAHAYLANSGAQVISLFSNGFFVDRAVTTMDRLSSEWPKRNFVFTTSIDHLGSEHDEYRRLSNGFEKALTSYESVRALDRPNIDLSVNLTVSRSNQDVLDEIYDYLVHERGVRTLACTLVRGNPLDPESAEVDPDEYRRFADRIDQGMKNGELDCFAGFRGASLVNAKSVLMRRLVEDTVADGYQTPCYAGRLLGVVYANGDVYPCEMLDTPMGNLRDTDMSMPQVWSSESATGIRDGIWETNCHCTYECAMTVNILFNPRFVPRLVVEAARQRFGDSISGASR